MHIPTVLDALFDPHFFPPEPQGMVVSRAYNWDKGRWGFKQVVHSSMDDIIDSPNCRFLGVQCYDLRLSTMSLTTRRIWVWALLRQHVAISLMLMID